MPLTESASAQTSDSKAAGSSSEKSIFVAAVSYEDGDSNRPLLGIGMHPLSVDIAFSHACAAMGTAYRYNPNTKNCESSIPDYQIGKVDKLVCRNGGYYAVSFGSRTDPTVDTRVMFNRSTLARVQVAVCGQPTLAAAMAAACKKCQELLEKKVPGGNQGGAEQNCEHSGAGRNDGKFYRYIPGSDDKSLIPEVVKYSTEYNLQGGYYSVMRGYWGVERYSVKQPYDPCP